MKYEDARRLRGIDGVWFRLKLWLSPAPRQGEPKFANLNHLSEHERRDIGLPESVRYVDWQALRKNGWDRIRM